jgi:hypothetical protein
MVPADGDDVFRQARGHPLHRLHQGRPEDGRGAAQARGRLRPRLPADLLRSRARGHRHRRRRQRGLVHRPGPGHQRGARGARRQAAAAHVQGARPAERRPHARPREEHRDHAPRGRPGHVHRRLDRGPARPRRRAARPEHDHAGFRRRPGVCARPAAVLRRCRDRLRARADRRRRRHHRHERRRRGPDRPGAVRGIPVGGAKARVRHHQAQPPRRAPAAAHVRAHRPAVPQGGAAAGGHLRNRFPRQPRPRARAARADADAGGQCFHHHRPARGHPGEGLRGLPALPRNLRPIFHRGRGLRDLAQHPPGKPAGDAGLRPGALMAA